jgi:hypothetical protein
MKSLNLLIRLEYCETGHTNIECLPFMAVKSFQQFILIMATRGQCYDHNFLRFFSFFGEKIGVFLKYQCHDQFFQNLALFLVKMPFFTEFFDENI